MPNSPSVFVYDQTATNDLLVVFGEVDIANADEFRRALERCARSNMPLIIDLRACTYIDSSGLHVIIDFKKKTRPELRMLANPTGGVARIIEIFGLSRYVEVLYATENAV